MNSSPPNPVIHASPARCAARRPRHQVRFFCDAPEAACVRLVGDFNGWNLMANPMRQAPDGRWMASLEVSHGHHRYLFIVDGRPRLDPFATGMARGENNQPVSLIAVS